MHLNPIVSEVDFDLAGRHHLVILSRAHSVHRSAYGWLPFPVVSIRNLRSGPVVLVMAGNHGDEYGRTNSRRATRARDRSGPSNGANHRVAGRECARGRAGSALLRR